jgi:hypothetical protein
LFFKIQTTTNPVQWKTVTLRATAADKNIAVSAANATEILAASFDWLKARRGKIVDWGRG